MNAVLHDRGTVVNRAAGASDTQDVGQIGPWRLSRLVSTGRMCRVYQATPSGGQSAAYAVKVLSPEHEQDAAAVACLRREAQAGREVVQSNLAPVLSWHLAEPPYYLVLPWLSGVSLATLLKSGPLVPCTALWIARQAAEALDALHASRWTHGDVKPENILVSPQRHATLLDLGFARHQEEPAAALRHCLMGTAIYMAPEQFSDASSTDIRSDLYSLGVTLYEMLTGHPPFSGRTIAEVIRQHRGMRPANVRRMLPHLPREAAALVAQLLAKQPLRRPQTPRELVERLVRLEISLLADR